MNKTLVLTLAAATALVGTAAHAQGFERGARGGAEQTRDTIAERAASMFERMDVNDDGRIDDADRAARQDARFERADLDKDGAITPDEFAAVREQRGERHEERRAAREERGGERMARGEGRRGMRGHGRHGGGMRMLAQADGNGDNAVTQAELTTAMLARFDAADANGDGTLTREERQEQRQQRRAERSSQDG